MRSSERSPGVSGLEYAPDYKTMQSAIVDEWAIEVGYTDATFKMSANAAPASPPRTKSMRLLKRRSDVPGNSHWLV